MHIWADIFIRELAMLVTLLALGSAPAAFLGRRFDPAARIAMAPVLGLCLGTCLFTTLLWFTAAGNTYWLLPIVALASVVLALWRGLASVNADKDASASRSRFGSFAAGLLELAKRLRPFDAAALVLVCIVVAAPLSYTLHERHSVGPIGFDVWDAVAYTAEIDAMEQQSIRQATDPYSVTALSDFDSRQTNHSTPANINFIRLFWTYYASGDQNLDAAPLSANFDVLINQHATDTQSLFLIVFLMAGALGAFATVRYFAPKPNWAALLGGVLFAGPFFLQLMTDGSQAATCGLAVILPISAIGTDVLRDKRPGSLIILALLISGLMALYPIFVPAVAISGAIILAAITIATWWRGQLNRRRLLWAIGSLGLVIMLSILFNLVSFTRDVRYWEGVLNGSYYISSLPQYHIPYSVLPGWLFQTREFYSLTELGSTSFGQVLVGVILPVVFIMAIVFGLKRRRVGLVLALLVAVYAAMAWYTSSSHHCSYCTDRALLPIAPLSIGLLAIGIAVLATAPRLWLRCAGIAIAVIVLAAVASRVRQERLRFADGAYFFDSGSRALLSQLPASHPGTVNIEGYGEDPGKAPGELPLAYYMVSEHNHEAVSTPSEYTDYASLAYLGEANPANPQFDPDYRYVLTRFGGVENGRRTIARTGPLALQERTQSLDATLVSGVAVPLVRLDPTGLAWVEGQLHMLVVGGGSAPAWISLRFQTLVTVGVPHQRGVTTRSHQGVLTACVRASGKAPLRKATLSLDFLPLAGLIPPEPYALQEPPQGVQLVAIRAVTHCSVTGGT